MPTVLRTLLYTLAYTHLDGISCLRDLVIMFGEISGTKVTPTLAKTKPVDVKKSPFTERPQQDLPRVSW